MILDSSRIFKSWLSACGIAVFIFFSIANLYVFLANLPKERIAEDLLQEGVRFDSDRANTISAWKAKRPQTCLWSINNISLEIDEILLGQAFSIGEEFETIVPILGEVIDDTNTAIKCAPMRYQAIDLRRRIEVITGFDEARDQKLKDYVSAFSN